jgi:hypothetical protein
MIARRAPTFDETSSLAARKGFRLVAMGDREHLQLTDLFTGLPALNSGHHDELYFSLTEASAFLRPLHDRQRH